MSNLGKVCLIPYKSNELSNGTTGILCSNGEVIDIVEIDHISLSGHYSVIGHVYKDIMEDDMYMAGLYVKSEDKKVYPLVQSDWRKVINNNNINKIIKYKLLDSGFIDGGFMKLCVKCGKTFSGDKKQQYCESCSNDKRYATVLSKRPRIKRLIV
jgi:hypothetical protein